MSADGFKVRHVDLSTAHTSPERGAALSVFWWKDLPLGTQASLCEELPYSHPRLRQLASEFAAAQLEARSSELGAPLRATYEGWPKPELSLATAAGIENPV